MIRVLEYSSLLLMTTPSISAPNIPAVDPKGWPSLSHLKVMGKDPSKIWQETADLIPSLSNLLGKRKGMMVGGAVTESLHSHAWLALRLDYSGGHMRINNVLFMYNNVLNMYWHSNF